MQGEDGILLQSITLNLDNSKRKMITYYICYISKILYYIYKSVIKLLPNKTTKVLYNNTKTYLYLKRYISTLNRLYILVKL